MKNDQPEKEKTGGNYPYYPLALCLPIADAVKSLGNGKTPVSKSLLASILKENERSQTLTFKIASAKSFGLIEGRSNFLLTEISKRYYFPTDQSDKQNALLDVLESPPAFKKLIERFDGSKLQPTEILGNILHREAGVPQSWKDRVAVSFVKSAQFASAIDEHGYLRVKASREGQVSDLSPTSEAEIEAIETGIPQPQITRHKRIAGQLNANSKDWSQTANGRTIYLEYPMDINSQEWEDLNRQIQRIKPKEKNT
jgi:hypothetical protein